MAPVGCHGKKKKKDTRFTNMAMGHLKKQRIKSLLFATAKHHFNKHPELDEALHGESLRSELSRVVVNHLFVQNVARAASSSGDDHGDISSDMFWKRRPSKSNPHPEATWGKLYMTKHQTPTGPPLNHNKVKKDDWFAKLTPLGMETIIEIATDKEKSDYYNNIWNELVEPFGDAIDKMRWTELIASRK